MQRCIYVNRCIHKWFCRDLFDLELRLPEVLKKYATEVKTKLKRHFYLTKIEVLSFRHNVDLLREALSGKTSVAVRFKRDDK